jgi:hypothetical protein
MNRFYLKSSIYPCAMLAGSLLLLPVPVQAATVFAPTDGDVNFLFSNFGAGTTLAMFDDSDQNYLGASLTVTLPSTIGVFGPVNGNNDYLATNSLSDTLTLTGSNHFILGLSLDGGANWMADSSVTSVGANAYMVTFDIYGSVLQVDVTVVPAVPLPAAAWLFASGLLGLVGVARKARVPGMSLS